MNKTILSLLLLGAAFLATESHAGLKVTDNKCEMIVHYLSDRHAGLFEVVPSESSSKECHIYSSKVYDLNDSKIKPKEVFEGLSINILDNYRLSVNLPATGRQEVTDEEYAAFRASTYNVKITRINREIYDIDKTIFKITGEERASGELKLKHTAVRELKNIPADAAGKLYPVFLKTVEFESNYGHPTYDMYGCPDKSIPLAYSTSGVAAAAAIAQVHKAACAGEFSYDRFLRQSVTNKRNNAISKN